MKAIVEREFKNYLKKPLFWLGVLIVLCGVYQNVKPYLMIHYVDSEKEFKELAQAAYDEDISAGYVPTKEEDRRQLWEEAIHEDLVSGFQMKQKEAEAVIEEMNSYIESKLKNRSFSWYFSKKFADFAGLFMGFFATVMLAVLFWQDTRKNTYELLHTKPVSAGNYVSGKIAGGFLVCLLVLVILNLVFWIICLIYTKGSGFEVNLTDFLIATGLYVLPNMLMIVSVYALISLLFKNPLPAVPLLVLYMIYSNMGSRNAEGKFGYYGRPFAIMVRFPGQFFDTAPPPMAMMNQSFLIVASVGILLICVQLWKKRRV